MLVFGAPGVGKGTYSKLLAAPLGCRQVEAGSLVRESPKWKRAGETGRLIPGTAVAELLRPAVRAAHADGDPEVNKFYWRITRAGNL